MKVTSNGVIWGVRLIDSNGVQIVDETFDNEGEWITKDIPECSEIIGFFISKQGDSPVAI